MKPLICNNKLAYSLPPVEITGKLILIFSDFIKNGVSEDVISFIYFFPLNLFCRLNSYSFI